MGYITIDRKFLEWEWWSDINTCRLFMYMLINATWEDDYSRGCLISSLPKLSAETNLTINEVRTAIKHLKTTGEITSEVSGKTTVFTIKNDSNLFDVTVNFTRHLTGYFTGSESAKNVDFSTKNECGVFGNHTINHTTNHTEIFKKFWDVYPKMGGIQETEKEFAKILSDNPSIEADQIIESAKNYAEYCKILEREEQFIKSPENWLRESHWLDFLPENYKKPNRRKKGTGFSNFQERDYDMDVLEKELLEAEERIMRKKMNKITVYTDGSSMGNGSPDSRCGWACKLIYCGKEKIKSGSDVGKTNNYMEVTAVLMAMKSITNKEIPVEVFSDSQYVVETLNGKFAIKSNVELWKEINEEKVKFSDIKFFWVKGHDKNQHNIDVDRTAVAEAKKARLR